MKLHILLPIIYFAICTFSSANSQVTTPQTFEKYFKEENYEEIANILKISDVNLVNKSKRKVNNDTLFIYNGLDFSDILVRPGQVKGLDRYKLDGIANIMINKWENGIVPYYITDTYFENETQIILNEISESNRLLGPNVNFRPYQEGDEDYVLIFKGGCGCYTNLGKVGGPQAISLLAPCLARQGVVTHELQHVLGIGHETNRNDRDKYFRMIEENIPEVLISTYEKYNAEAFVNVGPFDYYSIMHFPVNVPAFNLRAFDVLQPGVDESKVGLDQMLTQTDIERIKTIYN